MDSTHSLSETRAHNTCDSAVRCQGPREVFHYTHNFQSERSIREQPGPYPSFAYPDTRKRPHGLDKEAERREAKESRTRIPWQGPGRKGKINDFRIQKDAKLDRFAELPLVKEFLARPRVNCRESAALDCPGQLGLNRSDR